MEIRITEKEVTAGVISYLNGRGFNLNPDTVQITYTQGRKGSGLTAVVDETPLRSAAELVEERLQQAAQSTSTVVQEASTSNGIGTKPEVAPEPEPEAPAQDPEPETPVQEEAQAPATEQAETTSLFK